MIPERKIKIYARALFEALSEVKEEKEARKRITNFLLILKKRNDLYLIKKIIKAYEDYYKKKKGISEIEVISPNKVDARFLDKLKQKFENSEIIEKIDKSLIAGAIIRKGDIIIDGSIKRKLKEIKKNLEKKHYLMLVNQ